MKFQFIFCFLLACLTLTAEPARHVKAAPTGELVGEDGKPVFLISTSVKYACLQAWYKYQEAFKGTYPLEFDWLYGRQTSVEMLERCGFNALNFFSTQVAWRSLAPDYAGFGKKDAWEEYTAMLERYGWQKLNTIPNRQSYEEYIQLIQTAKELPVYVDFHTGRMVAGLTRNRDTVKNLLDPTKCFAAPDQHPGFAIRYRLGTPEGRGVITKLYRHEVESFLALGIRPFVYKLFNEADYKDHSPGNYQLFRQEMKRRYGSIDKLNRDWNTDFKSFDAISNTPARNIEFKKFQERQVIQLATELRTMIRELDPGAFTLGQVHNQAWRQNWNNFNLYLLNREMDFVSTGTGNYTFSSAEHADDAVLFRNANNVSPDLRDKLGRAAFYRALAEGKPLVTTEAYFPGLGERYLELKKVFWHEMIHGSSLVNMWEWIGYWAPRQKLNRISYGLHSQHVVSPASWRALGEVRDEIAAVRDFFQIRQNRSPAKAASLFSYPTLRANQPLTEGFLQGIMALSFRQIPVDAILEEQLTENRQNRYRALLALGVKNVYPETNAALRKFVEAGGLLVTDGALLNHDEYDYPLISPLLPLKTVPGDSKLRQVESLNVEIIDSARFANVPAGWKVLHSLDGKPIVLGCEMGKGRIVAVATGFRDNGLSELLLPLLNEAGIESVGRLRRADSDESPANIAIHRGACDDMTAWYLVNYNDEAKVIRLTAPELKEAAVVNHLAKERYPVDDDTITIMLPPQFHQVVIAGPMEKLKTRFGDFGEVLPAKLEERRQEFAAKKQYVRPSTPVDLTRFANAGFDNQQGWATGTAWSDGTHKELRNVPFHGNIWKELNFNIIRFDYNDNKTCIALKSKPLPEAPAEIGEIPLKGQFRGVAFLHAVTHGKPGETALTYRFTYEDGTTVESPMTVGREIGDWVVKNNPPELQKAYVWKTVSGLGFFLYEWNNPYPSKVLKSLAICSGNGESAPIVVAVTTLPTTFKKVYPNRLDLTGENTATHFKTAGNGWRNDGTLHKQAEGMTLTMADGKAFPIPPGKLKNAVLRFQVTHGYDQWGKQMPVHGYLWPLLTGEFRGKTIRTESHQSSRASNRLTGIFRNFCPADWNEVELPLGSLLIVPDPQGGHGTLDNIQSFIIQSRNSYQIFRDLRIEY